LARRAIAWNVGIWYLPLVGTAVEHPAAERVNGRSTVRPSRGGRVQPPIRFVTTGDGVDIACCASGSGPPLLLVRGWISDLEAMWADDAFRSFFEPLTNHRTLVRFDARGNGLSERAPEDLSLDALLADVDAVVEGLGLEQVTLLGSVYGSAVAAAWTARHPERVDRLVLDTPFARGTDLGTPDALERILTMISMAGTESAAWAPLTHLTSPDLMGSHRQRIARNRRAISPEVAGALFRMAFALDITSDLAAIRAPTLVLHRRKAVAVPLAAGRRVAALVPGARFVALSGSSANLWEDDVATVFDVLGEFLGLPAPVVAPARHVPAPTRAVLFTDLEGSTALTSALGDRAAQELLHEHDQLVRTLLDAWGGREVKHTGDGIMASFPSVSGALSAAVGVQQAISERNAGSPQTPLAVRVGINAGEPIEEGDDLYGTVVQLAARLCAAAEPGQVLVSNVVRELVAGKGFRFDDLGEAVLKGFPDPVHRHALRQSWRP
jgi:class 3 adenylate cyclase